MILISKVKSHTQLGDFTLISLVGALYKLVAKALGSRLGLIMKKIVSINKSTFLKWRVLVDRVEDVNEVLELDNGSNTTYLIFRVDFEKVYNSVSWGFLDYIFIWL